MIEIGDWLVAGDTTDTIDMGPIVAVRGDDGRTLARVAWLSGDTTEIDIAPEHVEIYADRSAAEFDYEERLMAS